MSIISQKKKKTRKGRKAGGGRGREGGRLVQTDGNGESIDI